MQGDLQDQKVKDYKSPLGKVETETALLGSLRTQSGFEFPHIEINYLTLGKLSPQKDNVVLICHALSGNALVAGEDPLTGRPGWWDYHVGPGKTIDTEKYFVISTNVLGGCNGSTGPGSINPTTEKPYGSSFPIVTIRDMVKAQVMLLDHLGLERIFAVIGGSMGGMQAQVFAVEYAHRTRLCIPLASCMAHSAMQIAFNEVGRQAIITDPLWNGGDYYDKVVPGYGLAVARMIGHITYLSEFSMQRKFGRKKQDQKGSDVFAPFGGSESQFSVEGYLHHQGESFVRRFDPNSYLHITRALDSFDLLDGRDPETIFQDVKTRFLVISFESDWLYPPLQSKELVRMLKRSGIPVTYLNLDSPYGHDSFLIVNPEMSDIIRNFLSAEYEKQKFENLAIAN